ncbi:MAG: ribonuclease P protein component [bacterium]
MGDRLSNIDQCLPKHEIINKDNEFKKIFTRGRQWNGRFIKCFVLHAKERKVGFIIAKRVGKAVIRNRIKRFMRETYRKNRQRIQNFHILICARKQSRVAGYQDIYDDFQNFLKSTNDY